MPAFVPARDAHLLLAIPALPFFSGPSGVSLLRLFLAEPLPIVVLSGAKHNIFCALFMTFLAKFPDYSHSIGDFNVIRFHVYIVAAAGFAGFAHTVLHKQFFIHRMILKVDFSPRVVN